jgi:Glucose-6-phosphate dehydrogenase, C-terminal domain
MGGADQRPLCLHGLKATQQELSKSSCLLDLPEHRLHDLLKAWRIVRPVPDAWRTEKAGVPNYDSGGDGPAAADELLARDGERILRPVTTSLEQTL